LFVGIIRVSEPFSTLIRLKGRPQQILAKIVESDLSTEAKEAQIKLLFVETFFLNYRERRHLRQEEKST
jgi:hypothetical protein